MGYALGSTAPNGRSHKPRPTPAAVFSFSGFRPRERLLWPRHAGLVARAL